MVEPRFRFWYSMMKSSYYREIFIRRTYRVPPKARLDERKRFAYPFRSGDDLRRGLDQNLVELTRRRMDIGPVMNPMYYYEGMRYYHIFEVIRSRGNCKFLNRRLGLHCGNDLNSHWYKYQFKMEKKPKESNIAKFAEIYRCSLSAVGSYSSKIAEICLHGSCTPEHHEPFFKYIVKFCRGMKRELTVSEIENQFKNYIENQLHVE